MKRTVVYWNTKDTRRKAEVRKALGITCETVNRESEYNGDYERLIPYVEEGLITIRTKENEEIRRKKVCVNTIKSKPEHGKKIGCSGRTRKV